MSENKQLAVYKEYRTQITDFKKLNDTITFDYESKKGNKDARSHIAKMKKAKAAVEKTRIKEAKVYREQLNDQAEEIKTSIDAMILVHQTPLDEFENREAIRIKAIKDKIGDIFTRSAGTTSEEIKIEIDYVNGIDIDDDFWEEFLGELLSSITDRLKFLTSRLEARVQYEADQAELEKFRQEQADRDAEAELKRIEAENFGVGDVDPDCIDESFVDAVKEIYPTDRDEVSDEEIETIVPDPAPHKKAPVSSPSVSTTKANPKKLAAINALVDYGLTWEKASEIVRRIGFRQIPNVSIDLSA